MKRKDIVEILPSYPYQTAGRTWLMKDVALVRAIDGSVVLPGWEIERMHRIVANEICGAPSSLTASELEFLCDATATRFHEVADFLGFTKGSVTVWKRPGKVVPLGESLRLKRWFWYKMFAQDLVKEPQSVSLDVIADDARILEILKGYGESYVKKAS